MPDLLLELFSEEIPARMQARAAEDLRKLVTDGLVEAGLTYEGARAFATPRRLALNVVGIPLASPDTREERRGPRVGAPEKAIEGFLRGAGLSSIDEARIESDPKKGDFHVAMIEKPGRAATEVIAEIVPAAIRAFPWPKSMRWGAAPQDIQPLVTEGGQPIVVATDRVVVPTWLRWVRPLHSILCVFGPETEETEVVDFEIGGIRSGRLTRGHRFMAPDAFEVRRFEDYVSKLEAAKVILDGARRREMIRTDAKNLAFAQGLEVVEDDAALLDEVAGLVEWPVVLMGEFDRGFLDIPQEVVRLTIRNNQKCFVLRDQASGELSNRFLLTANIEAEDGGTRIVAGNQRVIAARLKDAQFFWEQDRKTKLDKHAEKLGQITFHEKLGTQAERVERIARLARELSGICGADPDLAEQAARLCKADLVTGMVGEFPEVQGVIGRYYALAEGLDPEVADAIRDHYKPLGQGDEVPTAPVSIAVALADKLDMLVGFWAIDEKPTGSKDPYALRRAALGVIRIVLENGLRLPMRGAATLSFKICLSQAKVSSLSSLGLLHDLIEWRMDAISFLRRSQEIEKAWDVPFFGQYLREKYISAYRGAKDLERYIIYNERDKSYSFTDADSFQTEWGKFRDLYRSIRKYARFTSDLVRAYFDEIFENVGTPDQSGGIWQELEQRIETTTSDLLAFFADRLKVQLREEGARHDLVDAVFALGQEARSGAAATGTGKQARRPHPPLEGEGRAEGAGWGRAPSGKTSASPPPDRSALDLPPTGGGEPDDEAARTAASPPPGALSTPTSPLQGEVEAAPAGAVQDDLLMIVRRVEALGAFLETEDGASLLTAYRRAANILRIEEKKDGRAYAGHADPARFALDQERVLFDRIAEVAAEADAALSREDFAAAMAALARLRAPVDTFFDEVTVNADDPALRENRLLLLSQIRAAMDRVADFSRIGGSS